MRFPILEQQDRAMLRLKRDRSQSGQSRFRTPTQEGAAASDLRRSGGGPAQRLKKESRN